MKIQIVIPLLLSLAGQASADRIEVRFSPKGGCTQMVVDSIKSAKTKVRQAAYAYTSDKIASAMIERHQAGVDVQLVVDRSYAKRPVVERLRKAGVRVHVDSKHSIMHDKFTVVDDQVVETGSFNYTQAAETGNAENCLTIKDKKLAEAFNENWDLHARHSKP